MNVAAFSPDGKSLATVDDDGKLKLWETTSGRKLFESSGHKGDAIVARFTPDGKTIITAGRTDGVVKLWDRDTGTEVDRYNGHGATLSPDGAILAMLGSGGKLELRNVSSRTLIKSLPVAGELEDAAFSHDGTKLATAQGRQVQSGTSPAASPP